MPEKDGAEEKSTKSVVNKKQKQMMGEEGYDIARDMGRVRPSKDKKDATTMPPSKEMKKTQKVNKGPSALELVKKKYKGQIMDVKKEELDLTQVAKAFGGYIVEANGKNQNKKTDDNKPVGKGNVPFETGTTKFNKSIETTSKPAGVKGKEDATNPKMGGGPSSDDLDDTDASKQKKVKFGEAPGAGKVKTYKVDPKTLKNNPTGARIPKPKKVVKKTVAKQTSAAAADALKDIQKDTKVMGKTMPGIKQDVKATLPIPKTRRARKYKLSPEKQAERFAKVKAKIDAKNPTFIGASGKPPRFVKGKDGVVRQYGGSRLPVPQDEPGMKGFKGFKKRTQRSIVKTGKQVAKAVAPVTKPVAAAAAKAGPLPTAFVGLEVAKITPGIKRFFAVKPPLPPSPKGGKVGRRTAG